LDGGGERNKKGVRGEILGGGNPTQRKEETTKQKSNPPPPQTRTQVINKYK